MIHVSMIYKITFSRNGRFIFVYKFFRSTEIYFMFSSSFPMNNNRWNVVRFKVEFRVIEFWTSEIEEICGNYPEGFEKLDISSDPNYVFVNDPNFAAHLWDEDSDLVLFGMIVKPNDFADVVHK